MQEVDLRIKGSHEDLAALKEALYAAAADVDLQEETELKTGEHGEPFLLALVVALGGATLTREVLRTIRHWMDKRVEERVKGGKIETIKLYLEGANGSRDITLEQLMEMVG